ncbi:dihydrolipoamide acetyltransferase family protein [Thermus aquaticus]|jgi:pyruvate dehydrogenase E2 component (dihydrolipoamide acetyltransferase)|uniref:Dihydrolipoamide acetyltransferase component of pyruvate dehydrogenase complex n=1 Tax=Thermus aquaticus (strain ATCC BAA-2747 / Y51MC23) TaxID=498848 RepID=A0ABN4IJV7_THEA5|nr:dihydrolipoamide acetyltransferase family protein [Thermus aquaticus]ALJ90001.1 Dihydrolipoamide acyltransferase component of branched-chain alpha-keto acid dehydrogenase complex [Thermus aquaticus Y51MC23]
MPKEILMPELAESVVEGEILKWLVEEGDYLKKDQPFVEVMTDKVTVELPSPYEGVLLKKLAKEGEVVKVHAPIALIAEPGEAVEGVKEAPPVQAVEERSIVEPGLPPKEEREDLSLFRPDPTEVAVKNPFLAERPKEARGRVLAVPAARKLARELGIPIEAVPGSGPLGRVRVEDVRAYAEKLKAPPSPAPAPASPPPQEAPAPVGFPPPPRYASPKGYEHLEERVPLRGIRRTIAQGLWQSHLYTVRTLNVDEADLTELVALRERLKGEAEAQGVKLTYLPFIVKAVVRALKKYPMLNTSLDEERGEVVYKRYYHIGIAVATERGLIVPVVRDADRKSLLELAREIALLSQKAREGRLAPEEVSGSTFTITNIGSVGATLSFPIINVPEAAILGVHSIRKRPWVMPDGSIQARDIMFLSLSFDHRLVDGAEAAMFTREVIRLLEKPETLMLEM